MSLHFFEGGAGTGKTTLLITRLGQVLTTSPLKAHQRVLALTKMHGSRRRLCDRLDGVAGLNGRFKAATVDSFAWRLVRRWRSLARVLAGPTTPSEFDGICGLAGQLLEEPCVRRWVASSFPIVVVDELQDSKAGQLRLMTGLSVNCECIAAGDPFQDLEGDETCASVEWARREGVRTVLETTYRTSNVGLLTAAAALRGGQSVSAAGGFGVVGVSAWGIGAYHLASNIANWRKLGTVAVITPVGAARSTFVRQVVARVNSGPLGKKRKVGPFHVPWEQAQEEEVERTCRELGLPDDPSKSLGVEELSLEGGGSISKVHSWLAHQRRLFGRRQFTGADLRAAVKAIVQQGRTYSRPDARRVVAMTIHQAKNREFDRVIVLWPYEVSGNDERKRRLAYNAITRARYEAVVIVQGEARLGESPFVSGVKSSPVAAATKRRTRRAKSSEKPE